MRWNDGKEVLSEKVNDLRPEWRKKLHFSYKEKQVLRACGGKAWYFQKMTGRHRAIAQQVRRLWEKSEAHIMEGVQSNSNSLNIIPSVLKAIRDV